MQNPITMKDLQKTMQYIDKHLVFNTENFPDLEMTTRDEKSDFAARHLLIRMQKNLGEAADYVESRDQGQYGVKKHLEVATVKMLINVLRLGSVQGLTADKLLSMVRKVI